MIGKCIAVNGIAFSGKTTFVMKLLGDIPSLCPVQFELFYSKNKSYSQSSKEFKSYIASSVDAGKHVVCESVFYQELSNSTIKPMMIAIVPTYEQHVKQEAIYRKAFGNKISNQRTGELSIYDSRILFIMELEKYDYYIYNGKNYEQIMEAAKKYVLSG